MNKEQFESEMKRAVDKEIEKIPAIVNKLCKKAYGRDIELEELAEEENRTLYNKVECIITLEENFNTQDLKRIAERKKEILEIIRKERKNVKSIAKTKKETYKKWKCTFKKEVQLIERISKLVEVMQ